LRFLLTLILVALATPAAAQISAGPTGGLAVVDDNGKLLGGAVFFFGTTVVNLGTPQGSLLVRLADNQDAYPGFGEIELLFTNADCTGQAYSSGGNVQRLDGGPYGGGAGATLYAASGPQTSVTVASGSDENGVCQQESETRNLFPFTDVGDLANEFTPPFHLVTVASLQTASVPMHLGWLLGGLLLGLGVKRAVRR